MGYALHDMAEAIQIDCPAVGSRIDGAGQRETAT